MSVGTFGRKKGNSAMRSNGVVFFRHGILNFSHKEERRKAWMAWHGVPGMGMASVFLVLFDLDSS